jgi:NAD(P)-dependent dehydrogenase (short-subunit alcohol dehydrogenase family)
MSPNTDFRQKIALVTGAGQGLGCAIAQELVLKGAHVIAVSKSRGNLEELDDLVNATKNPLKGSLTLAPLDLSQPENIDGLIGGIHQRFGHINILFSAAAVLGNLSPLTHADNQDVFHTMNVNFFANQQLIRLAHPLLLQTQNARVAFVTCTLGRKSSFFGAYQASKKALETLVCTYAQEHKNLSLRINLISPPPMKTQLFLNAFPGHKHDASPPTPPSHTLVQSILSSLSLHEKRHGCIIEPQV